MARMSKVESKRLLDAAIRSEAAWALKDSSGANALGITTETVALKKAARKIYDGIVNRTGYSDNMLKATRSVKNFSMKYVEGVLSDAVESGLLEAMILAAGEAALISEVAKANPFVKKAPGGGSGEADCIKKMTAKFNGNAERAKAVCATAGRKKK